LIGKGEVHTFLTPDLPEFPDIFVTPQPLQVPARTDVFMPVTFSGCSVFRRLDILPDL